MNGMLKGAMKVRGDVGRKLNNALTMSFSSGPDESIASVVQGAGDGKGRKFGVLLGFINGGTGTHVITGSNGTVLHVQSREQKSTLITNANGVPFGEAVRADESQVHGPDGAIVFRVRERAGETDSVDVFRTELIDATGAAFCSLDVIRRPAGWALGRDLVDDVLWFGHAGQPLKIPLLGTTLCFERPPTALEGDLALAVCVDIAIGLRPYVTPMQ